MTDFPLPPDYNPFEGIGFHPDTLAALKDDPEKAAQLDAALELMQHSAILYSQAFEGYENQLPPINPVQLAILQSPTIWPAVTKTAIGGIIHALSIHVGVAQKLRDALPPLDPETRGRMNLL